MQDEEFPEDSTDDRAAAGGRDQLPVHANTRAGSALVERGANAGALSTDVRDPDAGQDGDEIDLLSYWHILLKRKWTVLTTLAIIVFTVLIATLVTTPIYRSTATIQIDLEATKVVEVGSTDAAGTGGYGYSADYYQTQYALLRSRSLAKRAGQTLVTQTGTQYLSIGGDSPWSKLSGLLHGRKSSAKATATSAKENVEAMTDVVQGGLVVQPVKDSRLVEISFDSPSAGFAAKAANTIAASFIASNIEHGFDASAYAKKYLEDGLAQLKAKLEDSEKQLVAVAQKEKIFNSTDNQTLSDQSLAQLNASLSGAQATRIVAEARWRQASSASGTELPSDMLGNSIIKSLQARRAELMGQYQDKLTTYKPAYPLMMQLKSQVDEIDKQIRSETGNVKGSARADYQSALAQETLLKQQIDSAKGDVLDLAGRSIQYNVLKREVDTNRQLYDGLLQRYKEVGLAGGVATNNISIVDPAEVPIGPYKPNLPRNLALALLGGLLLGGMLALGFEFLDDTLKTPADIEKQLGLAVLGIIPKLKNMTPTQALEDPRSAFSESYRSVRTALQFSTESGVPRSLLVTSARPAEGKSTSALTLAKNFAQLGKRVLLIDADLRNPTLHKTLGLDNTLGLSNCLAGAAKPQDVIHMPDDSTLHVILSGPIPPNPAELLAGPKMLSLLTVAMAKYDQVIIDGPPTIGLADAPIIAHVAMGTLLVIDAGETRKPIAKGAVKRLLSARARLVGALLTKVDAKSGSYGYGYGDYNYYTYGGDTPKLTRQ